MLYFDRAKIQLDTLTQNHYQLELEARQSASLTNAPSLRDSFDYCRVPTAVSLASYVKFIYVTCIWCLVIRTLSI